MTRDKLNIEPANEERTEGTSPDNAMSWRKAFIEDFLGRGVATECWNSVKSEVALRTRTETVDDYKQVNLAGLQAKWADTADVY